jgi:hypothetical protein
MAEQQLCSSFSVPVMGFELENIADTPVEPDNGVKKI